MTTQYQTTLKLCKIFKKGSKKKLDKILLKNLISFANIDDFHHAQDQLIRIIKTISLFTHRTVYWTDLGDDDYLMHAKIEKINMDGTERELVIEEHVGQPNHLFIDYQTDM